MFRRTAPVRLGPILAWAFTAVGALSCLSPSPSASAPVANSRHTATTRRRTVDIDALQAACSKESAGACVAFAEYLFWNEPDLRTRERKAAAETACRLSEPDGCAIAGLMNVFSGKREQGRALLVKGCTEGSFMACFAVKDWWPEEVNPRVDRVVPLLEASCRRSIAHHCVVAGVLVTSGYAEPPDPARGLALLEAGCKADATRCDVLSDFHATANVAGANASAAPALCEAYQRAQLALSETPDECASSFEGLLGAARETLTPGPRSEPSDSAEGPSDIE